MLFRNKLTVIVLMTVFLLTINGQYHDWYQDYWHMNDWNHNMGNNNMDPFNMDSMLPHDNNNIHNELQDPIHDGNNNNNRNYYDNDDIDPYLEGTIDLFYFICFIVLAGINICLCVKCLKRHKQRRFLEEQMRLRRVSFATLHGFDVQTLNDPRYSNTIHL